MYRTNSTDEKRRSKFFLKSVTVIQHSRTCRICTWTSCCDRNLLNSYISHIQSYNVFRFLLLVTLSLCRGVIVINRDGDICEATEDMITVGNRFIERMYFKVREGVENGDVDPRYINTKLNVSDMLTKGVNREIVRTMQAIVAGDAPWPDIPDAETALQNQVAYLQGIDLPV